MKQIYEKPIFEIIEIENKDIITYSYTGDDENYKNYLKWNEKLGTDSAAVLSYEVWSSGTWPTIDWKTWLDSV